MIADGTFADWSGSLPIEVGDLAVDGTGRRFLIGTFRGTIDLDGRPGTCVPVRSLGNNDNDDVVIVCQGRDGAVQWARTLGSNSYNDSALRICLRGGSVFGLSKIWGYSGVLDSGKLIPLDNLGDNILIGLDAASGATLPGFGTDGAVVLKGNISVYVEALTVSATTIYLGGTTSASTLTFTGSPPVTISTPVYADAFIAALDATTGLLRPAFDSDGVAILAGPGTDAVKALGTHADRIYAVVGSQNGLAATAGAGQQDAYVCALDALSGTLVPTFGGTGIVRIGGAGIDNPTSLTVNDDAVYLTGSTNSADLGIAAINPGGFAPNDLFIAALRHSDGAALPGFGTAGLVTMSATTSLHAACC